MKLAKTSIAETIVESGLEVDLNLVKVSLDRFIRFIHLNYSSFEITK